MAVTTRGNVTGTGTLMQNYLNKTVVENLEPKTRFYGMAQKSEWLSWYNTLSWTRMRNYTVSVAAATLLEWATGTEQLMVMDSVTMTATQYGLYVIVSDLLVRVEPVKTRGRAAKELTNNMARIYDTVIQDVLSTNGINVIYGGTATSRATVAAADTATMLDLAKANAFLSTQGADEYGQGFVAVMHPNVIYDLWKDPATKNITEVVKYTNAVERIFSGEIGMIHNVRVIKSSNIKTFTNPIPVVVYPTYIMGADAYGTADLKSMETYYSMTKTNGVTDTSDPLAQRNTVGVKGAFGCLILQQKALIRLETASSLSFVWNFNTDGSTTNF